MNAIIKIIRSFPIFSKALSNTAQEDLKLKSTSRVTASQVTLSPPSKREQELMLKFRTAVTVSAPTVLYLIHEAESVQNPFVSLRQSLSI